MLEEERSPAPSTRLGQYEILECIGRGGMGTVYRARHVNLDIVMALKVLSPRFAADPGFVARFEREARAAAALSHPNIVRVSDAGEDRGLHYIVMELVDGVTLSDVLARQEKIDVSSAVDIVRQIADALAHAEEHQIVHRDITPGNIMITSDGHVKLADLGLAKRIGSELATGRTETGATIGTPYYMSPEQVVDSGSVDHRSDIYALGATLYHLVTGKRPFDGGSAYEIMRRVETEKPVPLSKLDSKLPQNLCNLVERMMAKNPNDRYQTASELLSDLQRVHAGDRVTRVRRRMRSLLPAGEAKHYWKGALVAGVSAALVALALIVGFLREFHKRQIGGDEPSVVTVPTRHWEDVVESHVAPDKDPLWKTTLPTELPRVGEVEGVYTLEALRSRLVASATELKVVLEGADVVVGEIVKAESLSGGQELDRKLSLQETPENVVLAATYEAATPSPTRGNGAATLNSRTIFREREFLIEWRLESPFPLPGMTVGLALAPSLLEGNPTWIDEESDPLRWEGGPDAMPLRNAFAVETRGRTINVVLERPTGARMFLQRPVEGASYSAWRLVCQTGPLPAGDHRVQILITSIPSIRRQTYTARLVNGRLDVLMPDGRALLSDRFDLTGFHVSRILPTDYYRGDEGALNYIFATPPGRDGFLVKTFKFLPDAIELRWRWKPPDSAGVNASIFFLLAGETALGRKFAATTQDGEVSGRFSSNTNVSDIQTAQLDLEKVSVLFTPEGWPEPPNWVLDGRLIRIGGASKFSGNDVHRGSIRLVFSNGP